MWAKALRSAQRDSNTIEMYTNFILNHLNKLADVILDDGDQCLDKDIARMVWGHMLQMNQSAGKFAFYYTLSDDKDVSVFQSSL